VNAPKNPTDGFAIHTMNHGKSPRTKNTLKKIPQIKNHLRHFLSIVAKTSAFTTALSKLDTTSNKHNPNTLKMIALIFFKPVSAKRQTECLDYKIFSASQKPCSCAAIL